MKQGSVAFLGFAFGIAGALCSDGASAGGRNDRPFTWTGFYVGANLGYSWGQTDIDYSQDAGIFDGFGVDGVAALALTRTLDANGTIGGLQAGYNYQEGSLVLGIVTDFQLRNAGRQTLLTGLNSWGDTLGLSSEQNWLGTFRGRVGITGANRWLVYATGGLAFGSVEQSVTQTINGFGSRTFSDRTTKAGFVVGGGLEHALTRNWLVGAEYLYVDLGTNKLTAAPSTVGGAPAGALPNTTVSFDDTSQVVRVFLNYKFGSGAEK
jgi:outer membrane immunogenic protein